MLSTSSSNFLVTNRTGESHKYIDVAFDISRFGETSDARVLDSTTNANADRASVIALVQNNKFRPQMIDGQFRRKSQAAVRYYVTKQAAISYASI